MEEEDTKCRSLHLENFENVPRPSSLVDILNAELWIGEKSQGAIRFADNHTIADRFEAADGTYFLQFQCRWHQNEFSYIDLAYQVLPYTLQEAERLERLCNERIEQPSNAWTHQRA